MTRKSSLLVGAAVVLLGVGTYAALNQSSDAPAASKPGKPTTAKAEGDKGSGAKPDATNARASRERPAASSYPDLAEKYGESRTNLSRHVVDGFIGLLDEMLTLSESAEGFGKGFGGGGQSLGKLPEKLNLTAEQQEAAKKLLADRQKRQIDQAKALSEAMRKEPRQLVELTLAGDARARNQITVEEYESIAKRTEDFLKSSTGGSELGIGMRNRGDRDALFNDPEARAGFEKILDPTQAESFQQLAAEKPAKDEGEQISKTFPPMELEKLDQTLTSSRTMMEGMRKMMEGAKSLPEGSKFGQ